MSVFSLFHAVVFLSSVIIINASLQDVQSKIGQPLNVGKNFEYYQPSHTQQPTPSRNAVAEHGIAHENIAQAFSELGTVPESWSKSIIRFIRKYILHGTVRGIFTAFCGEFMYE